ncbi:MAG TPA: hypothetical protein DCZ97_00615, partial [Syntrophus sp. (in: bacteria)]|nr:hypothetical protein [Syntrophus sp. (in: bacteria)]
MITPRKTMQSILFDHAVTILLLIVWWLIVTGVGRLSLVWTETRFFSRGETFFIAFGIGLVVTGYAFFFLGIAQSLDPGSIIALLILLAFLAFVGWRSPLLLYPAPPFVRSRWDIPAAWLLAVVLFAGFLLVLTPETGKDALIYHLAAPKLYLRHHGFYFIPGNVFAGYPLLGEMHYLPALFFNNDLFAKAIHFTLLCGTLLGVGLLSRFLLRDHAFPALAMLLFASIPSVFAVSHAAYNDLFVAYFTLAALYAYLRWIAEEKRRWLIFCAIFSGAASACKYTALLLPLLGSLGILWAYSRRKEKLLPAIRHILLYAAVVFLVGAPFYLKSWFVTGNPFYPFFYEIFGGLGWDADQARLYDLFIRNLGMGREVIDYLLLPWNLAFRAMLDSPRFDGILGPIFILTLPFLALKRHWEAPIRIILVYLLFAFLFWASSAQQIRYLIPLLPLMAIVAGAIVTRFHDRKPIFTLLIGIIIASLGFNGYYIVEDFRKISPLRVAAGLESRDAFLARLLPVYPMYQFVNRELPPQSNVFLIYMKNYTFLCDHACYADAMFEAHTLQKILRQAASPSGVRDRLKTEGFTHLLYDERYLLGDPSPLSPEEKNLFISFRELH